MGGKALRLSMTKGNILASLKLLKTITRRCFRGEQPPEGWTPEVGYYCPTKIDRHGEEYPGDEIFGASDADWGRKSPYGAPGDPLVLTESWRPEDIRGERAFIRYRADDRVAMMRIPDDDARRKIYRAMEHGRWMPPMFMQTWASRAPAIVKSIRVERVQEISEEDAIAEGVSPHWEGEENDCMCFGLSRPAACNFMMLWDSINGDRPGCAWVDNPAVWCIEYELRT